MKFKFSQDLQYQLDAIQSITDIFRGQEIYKSVFSVVKGKKEGKLWGSTDTGYGNELTLTEKQLTENIQEVQLRNGLPLSDPLKKDNLHFSVEMETGTGKTYVYLRTILELNKQYGFTKFIIVVPSVAIREGVNATFRQTKEHFKGLYNNVVYDNFAYDSSDIPRVSNFATNTNIDIMIINIDAFNKSTAIMNNPHERLSDKPINVIKKTNPVVIIDEPQSVDNTEKAQEAIKSLNPLFVLRYSATHRQKINYVYKLDSFDAYEMNLVKQIEVAAMTPGDMNNDAYMRLIDVNPKDLSIKLELDVFEKNEVKRKAVKVNKGDFLLDHTKRDFYDGWVVGDVTLINNRWMLDFQNRSERLFLGDTIGGINDDIFKKNQIKKTIEEHLDKELRFKLAGLELKVLSLFFIDKVANYRIHKEDGTYEDGKYAKWFDEAYHDLIKLEKYNTLFELPSHKVSEMNELRNGYFSQDKGRVKDTDGKSSADDEAYRLIMKDKESLLDVKNKLRFIFSHSTLREGWDNPNVFQICTLNETKSDIYRRQTIGRGLRLPVNQEGNRIHDRTINTLTVMVNESYEEFVEKLQTEIEAETNIRFGVIDPSFFATIQIGISPEGTPEVLGNDKSKDLFKHFEQKGYIKVSTETNGRGKAKVINSIGKITDKLIAIIDRPDEIEIPDELTAIKPFILEQVKTVVPKKTNIKNKDNERTLKLNKQVYLNPDFMELWDRIKHKTTYDVSFSSEELINKAATEINSQIKVEHGKLIYKKVSVTQKMAGLETSENYTEVIEVKEDARFLPDVISFLQNETQLTRRTIIDILSKSNLECLKVNPQLFMEEVLRIIKEVKLELIVDGVSYRKLENTEFFVQELFETDEIKGYLNTNLIESKKTPYDYIRYDSKIESELALKFEEHSNVKVFAKLPPKFEITTPLGSYNPDWAILWEKNGHEKLYFVLESKGTTSLKNLRQTELNKIKCGKKHFEALDNGLKYDVIDSFDKMIKLI